MLYNVLLCCLKGTDQQNLGYLVQKQPTETQAQNSKSYLYLDTLVRMFSVPGRRNPQTQYVPEHLHISFLLYLFQKLYLYWVSICLQTTGKYFYFVVQFNQRIHASSKLDGCALGIFP